MHWSEQTPTSNNTRNDSTHGHHQVVNTNIRSIIFFAAEDGEALYSQQKIRLGADSGSDHHFLIEKFRLKLKKVGKYTMPLRLIRTWIPFERDSPSSRDPPSSQRPYLLTPLHLKASIYEFGEDTNIQFQVQAKRHNLSMTQPLCH